MKNKLIREWPLIFVAVILCFKISDKEFNTWSFCILSVSLLIFMVLSIFFCKATESVKF